jgi:hypothetical protein
MQRATMAAAFVRSLATMCALDMRMHADCAQSTPVLLVVVVQFSSIYCYQINLSYVGIDERTLLISSLLSLSRYSISLSVYLTSVSSYQHAEPPHQ